MVLDVILENVWVIKLILGVLVGSCLGTYLSIQIARRIIQGNAVDWLSEATEGETEASGLVSRVREWAEGDFAESVGRAVARELKEEEDG